MIRLCFPFIYILTVSGSISLPFFFIFLGSFFNFPSRYYSLSLINFTQPWSLPFTFLYFKAYAVGNISFYFGFFPFALHYLESFFPQLLRYISSLSIIFTIFIYGYSLYHYFDDLVDHLFISQSFTISTFFILFPHQRSLIIFSFILLRVILYLL